MGVPFLVAELTTTISQSPSSLPSTLTTKVMKSSLEVAKKDVTERLKAFTERLEADAALTGPPWATNPMILFY